jgi:hypothetical protein
MIFKGAMKAENLSSYELCGWQSENGKWIVGVRQVLYGRKVFCYQPDDSDRFNCYVLDYCTGEDLTITMLVLMAVMRALYSVNESISPPQLTKLFPVEKSKPIVPRDMECFERLIDLAKPGLNPAILPDFNELQLLLVEGTERARQTFIQQMEQEGDRY